MGQAMASSFYWHDYETTGVDAAVDRPAQFAGLRTDERLRPIGEPLVIYCRPEEDILPRPAACLVTGITPQKALESGFAEPQFIAQIHAELATPETCSVGYNSVRFDDEMTRYALYRNFYDPYEREWKHGNSRWDIIDMMRLARALRPDGIEWPNHPTGQPSFRLEDITQANNIEHGQAHDALADVVATIEVAKLVKQRQPQLYDYAFAHRGKRAVGKFLDVRQGAPFLHVSGMLSSDHQYAALMMPLAAHPSNSNAVICVDLSTDPQLLALPAEQIQQRLFTAASALPEDQRRPGLKLIHMNKCPVVATPKLVDRATAKRLAIDLDDCYKNWQQLGQMELTAKLQRVYAERQYAPKVEAEQRLYDGFLADRDRGLLAQVRLADSDQLSGGALLFNDPRYNELLLSYRARYYPLTLTADESQQWRECCLWRLTDDNSGYCTLQKYHAEIDGLLHDMSNDSPQRPVLLQLRKWGERVSERFLQDQ